MREWRLIRINSGEVVMIFYQRNQPEFNRSFGDPNDFRWESRPLSQDEIDEERANRRRPLYPDFNDLLLAVYAKEKGINQPMNRLVARIDAIHSQET